MSRIGKKEIEIPAQVKVSISGTSLTVAGPKGKLTRMFSDTCQLACDGKVLRVTRNSDSLETKAMHGLVRSVAANMVKGVSVGFKRELHISGVGYRAELKGTKELSLNLGYSGPVNILLPDAIVAKIEDKNTKILLESYDCELLGQLAARMRNVRPPEPYKGKGIKYSDEIIKKKAGKSGSKGK